MDGPVNDLVGVQVLQPHRHLARAIAGRPDSGRHRRSGPVCGGPFEKANQRGNASHTTCLSFPGCRCDSCRGKTSCSIHAGGRSGGGGGGGHLVTDEHLLLRRHAQPAGGGGRARPAGGGGGVAVGAEEGAVQAAVVAPGGGGGSRWGRTALASESSTADFLSRWKHFRKSECSVLCRIRIGASS